MKNHEASLDFIPIKGEQAENQDGEERPLLNILSIGIESNPFNKVGNILLAGTNTELSIKLGSPPWPVDMSSTLLSICPLICYQHQKRDYPIHAERLKSDRASGSKPVRNAMLIPLAAGMSAFLYANGIVLLVYTLIFLSDWWAELVVVQEPCLSLVSRLVITNLVSANQEHYHSYAIENDRHSQEASSDQSLSNYSDLLFGRQRYDQTCRHWYSRE